MSREIKKEYVQEMKEIIRQKRIYPVFQPIISLRDGKILGYEALSRMIGESCIPDIEELFNTAVESGVVWELEQLARRAAVEAAAVGLREEKLFLNVSPHVINEPEFQAGFTKECTEKYGLSPGQIIFEITERESIEDMSRFLKVVEHYKQENYQIAIDDVGSGYSGLNLICDVHPHYIKLDMKLIRNIHKSHMQYAMVKGLIELSNISNIQLIAEGIETREELESLINIGVHYGQGYLLGRPEREMNLPVEGIPETIKEYNMRKHSMSQHGVSSFYIKNIASYGLTISPERKVEEVAEYFKCNRELSGVCVVDQEKVTGILTRERLMQQLSGRYGYSLYEKKTVSRIMQQKFLEVDSFSSISAVSAMAMEREYENLYDLIVVTQQGRYCGIVTIKDLLQQAMEIDVNMARAANPLTGLPGNIIIDQEISRCIQLEEDYTVMYLDLDNFKAYNDIYGFEKGDEVIRLLAEVLNREITENGFIGHIGGDDFVVILYGQPDLKFEERIIGQFERKARDMYSIKDQKNGYIAAANRHGIIERFPLVSVTIVSVSSREQCYSSNYEISEELTFRKKKAKQKQHLLCSLDLSNKKADNGSRTRLSSLGS